MTTVIVDNATLAKLQLGLEQVQLCDESGRILGYFQPVVDSELYREVVPPFTDEELDRFEAEPGGRSLQEILADLEKRS